MISDADLTRLEAAYPLFRTTGLTDTIRDRQWVVSDTVQGTTIANTTTETLLYTLVVPANTLQFGDLLRAHFLVEVLARVSGEVRLWIYINGSQFVTGHWPSTSVGVTGQEYIQASVVDTGNGVTAARIVGGSTSGVDVVADLTVDNVFTFTASMTIADAGNSMRAVGATLGRL